MRLGARARSDSAPRSYGKPARLVQRIAAALVIAVVAAPAVLAADRPAKMVVLGDSLSAGYQIPVSSAFPAQLEKALRAKGLVVEIANAGVSGDTTSGGLARLEWAVPEGTEAVIVELGANDMLRGVDPKVVRAALEEIVLRLKRRGIEVLLCGMRAAPNLGADYVKAFDAIYLEIAAAHGIALYPFFLDGIAADPSYNQRDGIHPTAAGIAQIVARFVPKAEELLARVRAKRGP